MALHSIRLRTIYREIQEQLFNLIPERWSKIYLYASVSNKINNLETGEMFFYYFPKGLLKKNPVNVYEVPNKFNIEENSYLNAVDRLYNLIKKIRNEFKNDEEIWNSITITIENNKFTIIYNYENILGSEYTSYDRHLIWKYQYLGMPIEVLNRKDRLMLESYLKEIRNNKIRQEEYSENMYDKGHNVIEYDRQEEHISEDENNTIIKEKIIEKEIKTKKIKSKKIVNDEDTVVDENANINQILRF